MTGNDAIALTAAAVGISILVGMLVYYKFLRLRWLRWVSPDTLRTTARALSCTGCRHLKVVSAGPVKVMWCKCHKDALDYRFGQAIRLDYCSKVVR